MAASSDAPEPRRRGASDRTAGRGAWIGGGVVILALAIFIWRMRTPDADWVSPKELDERMPATDVNAPMSAPNLAPGSPAPGPAPPGKVWSPEHGHWHDIPPEGAQPVPPPGGDGSTSLTPMQAMPAATPLTPGPQPEGPVPPGKVWSPEHGHWHDAAPDGSAQPMQLTPIPAPEGAARPATPGTLTPQPEGPVPAGKVWSPEHGHWHDAPPG